MCSAKNIPCPEFVFLRKKGKQKHSKLKVPTQIEIILSRIIQNLKQVKPRLGKCWCLLVHWVFNCYVTMGGFMQKENGTLLPQ